MSKEMTAAAGWFLWKLLLDWFSFQILLMLDQPQIKYKEKGRTILFAIRSPLHWPSREKKKIKNLTVKMETGSLSPWNTVEYTKACCLVTIPLIPCPSLFLALQKANAARPERAQHSAKPLGSGTSLSNQTIDRFYPWMGWTTSLSKIKGNKEKGGRYIRSDPRRHSGPGKGLPQLRPGPAGGLARHTPTALALIAAPLPNPPLKSFHPSRPSRNVVPSVSGSNMPPTDNYGVKLWNSRWLIQSRVSSLITSFTLLRRG